MRKPLIADNQRDLNRYLALGLLKEKLSYSHEVADRQLAHVPKSSVDRAYDRAQFFPQRIEMMQQQRYAYYIDSVYLEGIQKIQFEDQGKRSS
ncbi:hypothetical protein [Algoriphagus sp.]|uniref:hypothetical protein n=1 Tax=Algoriphagus sp. TaxID=1872435 RepID=UPI00262F03C1|nr:hypothetical protein [Algoriphagus sp.]